MTTAITATTDAPRSVEEWQRAQRRQISLIAQLDGRQAARRGAELIAILETASAKIDRFGWNKMDKHIKDSLSADWCDVLSIYTLNEVRAAVRAVFEASKGKLRSINEYQVQEQIKLAHRKLLATLPPKAPEPEPERDFSPEAIERRKALSAEILGGVGKPDARPPAQSEA